MQPMVSAWWTRFPVGLRRVSRLLSEVWIDGVYLTAWPRVSLAAPIALFLFGLIEGATHWGLLSTANGEVSAAIHAVDFAQMLPLLFIAAICGALSSQLGLLLVLGFGIGDLFIAGSAFAPGRGFAWNLFHLHAPQLISYLVFFMLAVTPAITSKAMVASLPRWLRKPRTAFIVAAVIGCIVQAVSVYAWTLAAPMVVRTHWLWAGAIPPLSVFDYVRILDPWLPLAAAASMAVRAWLSIKAKGRLDVAAIAAARKKLTRIDQANPPGPAAPYLQAVGAAFLTTVLICGLFDSVLRGVFIFLVIAGLFLVRGVVLPKLGAWAGWSRLAGKVPLLLRWAGAIVITFGVSYLLLSTPRLSPAANNDPGAFWAEIICFVLGLAVSTMLLPLPGQTGPHAKLSKGLQTGARTLAVICALGLAARPILAAVSICLDPFCCFGGQALLAAIVVAALVLAALPLILALAEIAELGVLASEAVEATVAATEEEEIVAAEEALVPRGFESLAQFEQAASELETALSESGITDGTIGVRGSSVTGYSFRTGLPFGPGSDIDFFVESDQLTDGLPTSNNIEGMVPPRIIARNFPAISEWAQNWNSILGRKISVAGFPIGGVPAGQTIIW